MTIILTKSQYLQPIYFLYALKNKGSKRFFCSDALKNHSLVPQSAFQWYVLRRTIFSKNVLWN